MKKRQVLGVFGITSLYVFLIGTFSHATELDHVRGALQTQGASWVAGETSMSILTAQERAKRLGSMKSFASGQGRVPTSVTPPPALQPSIDWRNNGGNYVSGVRDQGQCKNYWAFAATAALESVTMISKKQPNTDLNLSEQVAVSCSGAGSCESGGYPDYVSNFIRDTGLPAESCYSYTATDGNCATACANWKASAYKITSWSWVVRDGQTPSVDTIEGALVDYGPLVMTMAVYNDFFYYTSGVYTHAWGGLAGYHAMLVVGYDDGGQYFIVKNSWGTGWGESGFFKIAYSELMGDSEFGYETIAYQKDNSSPTCDYSISKLFSTSGGTGTILVTAADTCVWHAASSASWITIASGSGTGTGTVQYTVADNTGASSRTGSITVEGQTYTITQAGGTTQASGPTGSANVR